MLQRRKHRPKSSKPLKEQASAVLALINGYLRYLRGRSSTVKEPDGAELHIIGALEDLPL
jgi:hypothetical protein